MANISRYDPFSMSRIDPFTDLDDFFKGFFVRPALMEGGTQAPLQIKMDVKENDNAYTIHADIPGVKKEDIQVSVDGNQVMISAESKMEKEEKEGEKVLRSERYAGKVSRSFTLPNEVDEAGADATYNEGVLELKLPKKEGKPTKRLEIK